MLSRSPLAVTSKVTEPPGAIGPSAGATPLLAAAYIGLFPSAIAYTIFAYALSKAPASLVTVYLYTVPVFSLLFAWLVLGEVPTVLTLVGGAVVVAGIVVVNRSKRGRRARSLRGAG